MSMFDLKDEHIKLLKEKYGKRLQENPDWKEASDRRNKAHVLGVQTFGKKLKGSGFEGHDNDKFNELYVPYVFISLGYNKDFKEAIGIDEELDTFMRWATYEHVTKNPHHPEYWDLEAAKINADVTFEDRDKPRNTVIDATKMPNNYLEEMICDWASVGAERGNSPQSWLESGVNVKWKFTDEQLDFMWATMEKIWPGGRDETKEVKHEERVFNDKIWEQLNKAWDEVESDKVLFESILNENEQLDEFINSLNKMVDQRDEMKRATDSINKRNSSPKVELDGVGSLQSLSFLFSNDVSNYVMTLLDSLLNNNYKNASVDDQGLGNLEFGSGFKTKTNVPNNFLSGLSRSLDRVNLSNLKNKTMLVTKLYLNMKKFAKTIRDKNQRKEYLKDMKSFFKVANIIKNIINNREKFINVLNKTLVLSEGDESVIVESGFVNIMKG